MSATDEQVSQFMSFTGSADPAQAASYLEMSGGNLETAVGLFMEHNQGGSGGGGMGGAHDSAMAAAAMAPHEVRAPDATRTMRLMDDVDVGPHPAFQLMNAMMDEQLASSAFAASPLGVGANARDVVNAAAAAAESKRDDDDNDGSTDGDENGIDDDDDDDDDVEVMGNAAPPAPARLSDMFAPPTHLIHKAGGFQGARAVAKDSKRWLLVNLQRDSEFSCHALNRDVWRDELVENLVREGFIFWQAMDTSSEGRTYSERYSVHDYPHLAIIDPRTGRLLWRKEGWTQEKPLTAESFSEFVMDFCSRNSFDRPPTAHRHPSANGAARPSKRPMRELSEDEELQAAMRASLQNEDGPSQDQEMVDGDDDEVEVLDDAADMKPAASEDTNDTVAEATSGASIVQDLLNFVVDEEPEKGARLQIRMHDGKRKVRKFLPTDTVKMIYAFVAQANEDVKDNGREFTLMAGYPPRDLFSELDGTIDSSKLQGEAVQMRWK